MDEDVIDPIEEPTEDKPEMWYGVINSSSGELLSVGTVIGTLPADCELIELGTDFDQNILSEKDWEPSTKTFVEPEVSRTPTLESLESLQAKIATLSSEDKASLSSKLTKGEL